MPKGKAAAERKHAKRRMRERFGIPVGDETLRQVVLAIQQGKADFYDKQSNRVTRWQVEIHGVLVLVCYDKHRKQIITTLPPLKEKPA